tara:strand:+ start:1134 stop:1577 length:444 start_codon:yes stop_codon:yes gene_type:complete
MKNTILLFALLFSSISVLQAQEKNDNLKNIKEETVIKTTTIKGINKETTETIVVKKEKQVIKINDSGVENQNEVYSSKKEVEKKEVNVNTTVNAENEAAIAEIKKRQKAEIEASKKEQLAKYEAERIEMEKKRAEELKKKNGTKKDN